MDKINLSQISFETTGVNSREEGRLPDIIKSVSQVSVNKKLLSALVFSFNGLVLNTFQEKKFYLQIRK